MEQTRSAGTSGVLRQACEEIARELFASAIACGERPDPSFSPSFEREIKRLISRTRNNRYHRLTRGAKVILVAAIIALLMILTVTASQLFGISFVKGEGFMNLVLNRPLSGENYLELKIGYIPEGFVLTEKKQLGPNKITYSYEDKFSREIQIDKQSQFDSYSVDTDRHQWTEHTQNSITYHLGAAISSYNTNIIIWVEPETNCLYNIYGRDVDMDTLFEIAKQVK